MAPRRWLPAAVFLAVTAVFLAKPLGIASLRGRLAASNPAAWDAVTTNGSFSTLVPHLFVGRYCDEALYAARVKQIFVHGVPYNPYLREDRSFAGWSSDFVSHYLVAAGVLVTGGGLRWGWPALTAVVAGLWALLFFSVFRRWSGKDEIAAPLALASALFPDLYVWVLDVNFSPQVSFERYASVFFQQQANILPVFHRMPSLFLTLLLLSLLFVALWRLSFEEARRPARAALVGLGFVLMRYVHPFEYAFGMASLTGVTVWAWAVRSSGLSRANLTTAFAVALAGAGVYGWMALSWGSSGVVDFIEPRFTRKFYLITLVHVVFSAWGVLRARAEYDPARRSAWLLLAAVQAAAFMVRNTQVVLGFELQVMHYIPMGSFYGVVMLALAAAGWLAARLRWDARAGTAACLGLMVWGLANQVVAAKETYLLCGLPRDVEAALAWVDKTVPKDGLVVSLSAEANTTIPLYTRAKVQIPVIGINFSGPFTREQFLTRVARLLKTTHADVDRFIAARWLYGDAKVAARTRLHDEQLLEKKVDRELYEQGIWFYTYYPDFDQGRTPAEHVKLRALAEAVEPIAGPFHMWVGPGDRALLSAPPESLGGRSVYRNPTVEIFEFSAGTKS